VRVVCCLPLVVSQANTLKMCADLGTEVASAACCQPGAHLINTMAVTECAYVNEAMKYDTAVARCAARILHCPPPRLFPRLPQHSLVRCFHAASALRVRVCVQRVEAQFMRFKVGAERTGGRLDIAARGCDDLDKFRRAQTCYKSRTHDI
jgi:hypothetical protein